MGGGAGATPPRSLVKRLLTALNLEKNYFSEMCSNSEPGSYLRLICVVSLTTRLESNNKEDQSAQSNTPDRRPALSSYISIFGDI